MKAARPYPIVTITPKGERAIVDGHPWVYEGEVLSISGTPEDGGLVDVVIEKGQLAGLRVLQQRVQNPGAAGDAGTPTTTRRAMPSGSGGCATPGTTAKR